MRFITRHAIAMKALFTRRRRFLPATPRLCRDFSLCYSLLLDYTAATLANMAYRLELRQKDDDLTEGAPPVEPV